APAPASAAAQAAAPASAAPNGAFKMKIPTIFNGGRKGELVTFLQKWEIFRNTNHNHPTMTNAYNQCCFFFTLLNSPAIDNWVAQKSQEWVIKVAGDGIHPPTHQDNDENLWHDLMRALRTSFTETHSA